MKKNRRYRIHHTDAFVWLLRRRPTSIHAVVTDPPFAVLEYLPEQLEKRRHGNGGIWRLPHNYDGNARSPAPRFTVLRRNDLSRIQRFQSRLAKSLFKVLVPGGHVIMSSQVLLAHIVVREFLRSGFEMRGQVVRIVKTLRGGDRPKGAHKKYKDLSVSPRSCWEPWVIFRKPCEGRIRDNLRKWRTGALRRPSAHLPFSDLIISHPARGEERKIAPHPSLKPQEFIRQLVSAALPLKRGILLDPFMGSGSTIAAASYHGFRSIGLETDKEFFVLAKRAIPKLSQLAAPKNGKTAFLRR